MFFTSHLDPVLNKGLIIAQNHDSGYTPELKNYIKELAYRFNKNISRLQVQFINNTIYAW